MREPTLPRPYRTWGYPATPLVFIALSGWMTSFAILERPMVALTGFTTLALCTALYVALSRVISAEPVTVRTR